MDNKKNMQYPDSLADGADKEDPNKMVYFGPQAEPAPLFMQLPQPVPPPQTGWKCPCGSANKENYKFCAECGLKRP